MITKKQNWKLHLSIENSGTPSILKNDRNLRIDVEIIQIEVDKSRRISALALFIAFPSMYQCDILCSHSNLSKFQSWIINFCYRC